VTKTPAETVRLAGDAAVDSWGGKRLGADVNQPLGGGVATRLAGVYETAHNHRRFYGLERWALNPTLGLELHGGGQLVIGYEHAEDHRTADRGVPSLNGRPAPGLRDTFFGDPAINRSNANVDALTVQADVPLTDALTLRHRSRYADYAKSYQNVFVTSAIVNGAVGVNAYREQLTRVNAFTQTDLEWRFATGQVQHQLLLGTELGRQVNDGQRINGFFGTSLAATVPVADPFITPAVSFRPGQGANARDNHARADIAAALLQDQISIGDHVIVTAGLRVDRFTLRVDNRLTGLNFTRTDTLLSPRLGLVLKPVAALSLYGSYSRSFLPQSGDQFTSLDVTLAALQPERFENWEVGGKWAISPALSASIAVYRLDRDNTRAPGAVAGTTVLTGSQRSEGIEAELNGRVTDGWQLQAGVALQRARITTTTVNAPAGRHVPLVPDFQASLWSRHHIAGPLDAALGVVHQSASYAGISNSVLLPAWTRLDGALFLKAGKNWQVQLNVENLLNTGYFPTAHTDNNISTGGPRAARLTLRAGF
jgi:catecholate siderophore receptor